MLPKTHVSTMFPGKAWPGFRFPALPLDQIWPLGPALLPRAFGRFSRLVELGVDEQMGLLAPEEVAVMRQEVPEVGAEALQVHVPLPFA